MATRAEYMNTRHHCRILGILLLTLPSYAAAPDRSPFATPKDPPSDLILDMDQNIYDNHDAFDLVGAAHKVDAMYSGAAQANRELAAKLYAQAIAAQPGAKGNAPLANRIAQMYAFNEDRAKGIFVDRAEARKWWLQCLSFSDDMQILWAQAQMGLLSVGTIDHDTADARERCEKILAIDPKTLTLPKWKDWSHTRVDELNAELERQRDDLASMQKTAKERLASLPPATRPAASAPAAATSPATRSH